MSCQCVAVCCSVIEYVAAMKTHEVPDRVGFFPQTSPRISSSFAGKDPQVICRNGPARSGVCRVSKSVMYSTAW